MLSGTMAHFSRCCRWFPSRDFVSTAASAGAAPVLLRVHGRTYSSWAASSSVPHQDVSGSFAFVGLGDMGYPLAGRLASAMRSTGTGARSVGCGGEGDLLVWNRSHEKSVKHAREFGTRAVSQLEDLADCRVVLSCVSTTAEVEILAGRLAQTMSMRGPKATRHAESEPLVWVDCTSGDPERTRVLAEQLRSSGIHLFDCPLSGGPRGARDGTVAAMFGGDDVDHAVAMPLIRSFTSVVQHCGSTGTGMAVKSVNNALNSAHVLLASEALIVLRRLGVCPAAALEVINNTDGRSLQTQVRLPEEVLTRRFGYGFKLGLMHKDCSTASTVLPRSSLLFGACQAVEMAAASRGFDADYSELAAWLECMAGVTLEAPNLELGLSRDGSFATNAIAVALAAAHRLVAVEGLLALNSVGVDQARALSVINKSSGRSVQTEKASPDEILTHAFVDVLGDAAVQNACKFTARLLLNNFPEAPLLPLVCEAVAQQATSPPRGKN
eukprot:TRINITY_DN34517_c0_g1_i1.p1 TRINITY_DN34517_c0_g1~~TRINITY_DN34517_c0_g1_i1.p1  ORF type:complete len:496 (+),score=68.64 TRINITY_DN34517_c0_g1_i1:44-1531(+)